MGFVFTISAGFAKSGRCFRTALSALAVLLLLVPQPTLAGQHPCKMGQPITGQATATSTLQQLKLQQSDQVYAVSGLFLRDTKLISKFIPADDKLQLFAVVDELDRYQRLPAHVFQGTAWLQGALLSSGQALANPHHENKKCRIAMFHAEQKARRDKLGLWGNDESVYQASKTGLLLDKKGHFTVIEGKVLSIGDRSRRLYLNFGQKWSQDFTALVVKKGANAFKGDLGLLRSLRGKRVRIRGIVEESGGPMIRLVHEGQIEVDDR